MVWVLVILIIVLVVGVIAYRWNKTRSAINNGDMIKRDNSFFKQNHTFKTSIDSIDTIYSSLDKDVFNRDKMECSLNSGDSIVFKKYFAGSGMTASLINLGEKEGFYYYKFAVNSFTTRKGMEAGYTDANIALTTVEKTIYNLDHSAIVERLYGTYKTRW